MTRRAAATKHAVGEKNDQLKVKLTRADMLTLASYARLVRRSVRASPSRTCHTASPRS